MRFDRAIVRYLVAIGMAALATGVALLTHGTLPTPALGLIYVLPVVIAAAAFGWGPALAASAGGVLTFNFFLLEPRYTLRVSDPANVWSLVLLVVVAAIVSAVSGEAHRRAREASRRAAQAGALQDLSRALTAAQDRRAIAAATREALSRLFEAPAIVVLEVADDPADTRLEIVDDLRLADQDAVRWTLASRLPSRAGDYPNSGASYDLWPVAGSGRTRAVLGLCLDGERAPELDTLIGIVSGHLAVALARDDFARQALAGELSRTEDRLRGELLAAVSHDLKTPLSSILVALQSLLRFGDRHDAAERHELLTLAESEAGRLDGMVRNLLDSHRLDVGGLVATCAQIPAGDIADAALRHAHRALGDRPVVREIVDADLFADRGLAVAALANLLENAGKYAPADTPLTLRFQIEDGRGAFSVLDEGPGFGGEIEPMFARFARGAEGDGRAPGTGLGLSIARGFAEAQGGRVEAANRTGGGACVRLILPLVT